MADEKKLIIDEDWKAQVRAEKESQQQPSETTTKETNPEEPADFPMPPASLEMLVSTLVTEVMLALGQIPHPLTGKANFLPHQAKYLIDTIEMLRDKTKGNTTPEETQMFDNLLHQLRMAFIQLSAANPVAE